MVLHGATWESFFKLPAHMDHTSAFCNLVDCIAQAGLHNRMFQNQSSESYHTIPIFAAVIFRIEAKNKLPCVEISGHVEDHQVV